MEEAEPRHDEYIFEVEDLLIKKRSEAHGRRLNFLRNSHFKITEEVSSHLAYKDKGLLAIESLEYIRRQQVEIEVLVRLKGSGPDETDWVTIESLRYLPVLIEKYLAQVAQSVTPRQRRVAASI